MEKLAAILTFAILISAISGMTPYAQAVTMGFQDGYDPANWTFNANGGDGSFDASNAPNKIMITGNDNGIGGINTTYEVEIFCDGTVSFDWFYQGEEGGFFVGGTAFFDPSGYLLNGGLTQLTDDFGGEVQSGSASTPVVLGDVFGFYIFSTDGVAGPGIFTMIDNFEGPTCLAVGGEIIPLDQTALLLAGAQSISMWMIPVVVSGAGIGVFVIMRTRK